jgi:hypothetical protein
MEAPHLIEWAQLALSALNLIFLPIAWQGVNYVVRTERRLAVIETKLGIKVPV